MLALSTPTSALADGFAGITHGESTEGVFAKAKRFKLNPERGVVAHTSTETPQGVVVVPVGLVPHTCAPRYDTGGVPLTYDFTDTVGDCATFAAPEPVAQRPGRPGRPPRPSPEEIARGLADRAVSLAPEPQLEVTPGGIGLTGLESFFWLAERPETIEAIAQAGPVTVIAQARPAQFVWDFGDGFDMVTAGSGRAWSESRSGSIGHVYETRGEYDLVVDVVWEARWRIDDDPWRSLGYFSNSDSRPYRVRQVIAVLTKPR